MPSSVARSPMPPVSVCDFSTDRSSRALRGVVILETRAAACHAALASPSGCVHVPCAAHGDHQRPVAARRRPRRRPPVPGSPGRRPSPRRSRPAPAPRRTGRSARNPFVPSTGSSVQNVAGGSPAPRSIQSQTALGRRAGNHRRRRTARSARASRGPRRIAATPASSSPIEHGVGKSLGQPLAPRGPGPRNRRPSPATGRPW